MHSLASLCESDSELQISVRPQKQISRLCKSKHASGAKTDAEMVLGSFVCSCDSAVRFLDMNYSSQRRLLRHVWRALSVLRSALDSSIQACAD